MRRSAINDAPSRVRSDSFSAEITASWAWRGNFQNNGNLLRSSPGSSAMASIKVERAASYSPSRAWDNPRKAITRARCSRGVNAMLICKFAVLSGWATILPVN